MSKDDEDALDDESSAHPVSRVAISQTWDGPIPPPSALAGYEDILPGAADRIVKMAEAEQQHRHSQERELVEFTKKGQSVSVFLRIFGGTTWLAALAIGGLLSLQGQEASGLSILGVTGLSWVAITIAKLFKNGSDATDD